MLILEILSLGSESRSIGQHMNKTQSIIPLFIAILFGTALWLVPSALTGKREAWDTSTYWVVSYPIAIIASGFLGRSYPERAWRWPVALFEAQAVAMCIRNGEIGNLLPVGVVLFAIIAVPGVVAAKWASRRHHAHV